MTRPRLVAAWGDVAMVFEPDEPVVVGRADHCAIRLDDGRISRNHARLTPTNDGWLLEDLGSTGGTFVAGDRVDRALISNVAEVRLADPQSGPLLRLEARFTDTADLETAEPINAASARARPPTGVFTAAHAPSERTRIGRAPENDVVVDDLLVSWHHAELHSTPGGFELVDLGSRNGTFVNGQPIRRVRLDELDLVAIGRSLLRLSGGRLEEYQDTGEVTFEAVGISATLANGQALLDNISFSLGKRTLLAVIGPSGSGKSSLLAALAGLRPAEEGSVLYGGRNLYEDYAELQNRIGFVPQDDVLHRELTVRTTLEYAGRLRFPEDVTKAEAGARIDDLLAELGIAHRDRVPLDQLSGGERKRTNVVSELLTEPSLLFLDEPTSGLDPGISRVLMQKLRELADDGRTIIVVTHELANLELCDELSLIHI